jgi:putative toxin-antitoxin system antitoxin component (TIGR02293 family)
MTRAHAAPAAGGIPREHRKIAVDLLGGAKTFGKDAARLAGGGADAPLYWHKHVERRFPGVAYFAMSGRLSEIGSVEWAEKAVGISARTLARIKSAPEKRLSLDLSDRIWAAADLLALAISVFGDQGEAERWFLRPAIGLAGRRPIDLAATTPGREAVAAHLRRIDDGVYV